MNKKIIKTAILTTMMILTFKVSANSGEPVFECSPEELRNSIQAYTVALRSPSPLPQASQVQTEIINKKLEEEEEGACAGLFSMERPSFDFKELMEGLSMPSFSMDSIKQKLTMEALKELRDKLAESFCKVVKSSAKSALEVSLSEIRGDYGVDFEDLRGSAMYLADDALSKKYGSNSKYFRDPDRFGEDKKSDANDNVRSKVRDLWN